jgi:hypothetical protein
MGWFGVGIVGLFIALLGWAILSQPDVNGQDK